ncbi:hypothetical protein BJX63DRAFT_437266 [Aspergillus granulosus]|uniref:Uncharacterized protein n=1 Tax=Aspergillus granulosus TaxID=176169 RepID=A0ABR4GVR0_9EURO
MADLQYLGGLRATNTEIALFSFPELVSVSGQVEVMSWTELFEMDFPKLRDAYQIVLSRRYSKLNFDSLEIVRGDLIIESCTFCDPGAVHLQRRPDGILPRAQIRRVPPSREALFQSASPLILTWASDSGLSIHVKQTGMELEFPKFPKLQMVDKQFFVHCAIMGLKLPIIDSVNGSFRVNTDTPLSLNVLLFSATWLQLDGNIKE